MDYSIASTWIIASRRRGLQHRIVVDYSIAHHRHEVQYRHVSHCRFKLPVKVREHQKPVNRTETLQKNFRFFLKSDATLASIQHHKISGNKGGKTIIFWGAMVLGLHLLYHNSGAWGIFWGMYIVHWSKDPQCWIFFGSLMGGGVFDLPVYMKFLVYISAH